MSIFHHCGSGFPVKEKGYTAEEYTFPVRIDLGRMEKILRTVTIMWSAIILALACCCLFAVNVGVSPRFAVFCYKIRKETRKMRRTVKIMSLILAMLLTLTACGGKTEAPAAAPAETAAAAIATTPSEETPQ